jgi:quercetin dioxygenase-like cupin family protein
MTMANFYDKWLNLWDVAEQERRDAPKIIHEEDIQWVNTPQDTKAGMLVAPETGFRTWGSETMLAEIQPGWHTGRHRHGEEGIHIVDGSGFSIINGVRYDWAKGSTLWVPFGAEHQHFNTGAETARYFSLMSLSLEHLAGIAKLEQLDACGPTDTVVDAPVSADGFDDKGRRIRLLWDEAPKVAGSKEDHHQSGEVWAPQVARGHHALWIDFMQPQNGFQNVEIEISGILSDAPHSNGGKHAHMEAILYILQGEGYSEIEGETIPWKTGSCFHVQGPQTMHQHFCTSDEPSHMLRCSPGLRTSFYQAVAKEQFPKLWYEQSSAI